MNEDRKREHVIHRTFDAAIWLAKQGISFDCHAAAPSAAPPCRMLPAIAIGGFL